MAARLRMDVRRQAHQARLEDAGVHRLELGRHGRLETHLRDHVTLRMHWYDSLEQLREAAPEQAVGDGDLQGFSILRRNTETGTWVCDVFVVKMRGALVDNDRTMTFGHELLHCFGLRHDE